MARGLPLRARSQLHAAGAATRGPGHRRATLGPRLAAIPERRRAAAARCAGGSRVGSGRRPGGRRRAGRRRFRGAARPGPAGRLEPPADLPAAGRCARRAEAGRPQPRHHGPGGQPACRLARCVGTRGAGVRRAGCSRPGRAAPGPGGQDRGRGACGRHDSVGHDGRQGPELRRAASLRREVGRRGGTRVRVAAPAHRLLAVAAVDQGRGQA